MISYNYECDFKIPNETTYSHWITSVLKSEGKDEGDISYIFCDDEYLLSINKQYLNHDYYTDVISFDYTVGNEVSGDIFISIDRVLDNSKTYSVPFENELQRVVIHGVLHFCGYKDKSITDEKLMRTKEDEKIKMFHVEQNL